MSAHRIISFLPAATEMVYALGLGDALVGVSHECDYPAAARAKPVVVRPAVPIERMSLAEIDVAVSARLGTGASLYEIDEALFCELRPTLILTQNLCQVCAPSGNEIAQVLRALASRPEILWLMPKSLAGVEENLRELGRATGRASAAETVLAAGRERLAEISAAVKDAPARPRVFCLEWVDPLYCSGHWISEMVERAGGVDALSRRGTDSVRIAWDEVVRWAPEVLVVMPCGFHLPQAVEQTKRLQALPGWNEMPAVRAGKVFAVDANAYFARPGPRLIDGVELLAHLIHPKLVDWHGAMHAFQRIGPAGVPVDGAAKERPTRIKRCSRCGVEFRCGPAPGKEKCWCDELPPVGWIAGRGPDCLCPACLRAAIVQRDAKGGP